MYLTQGLHRAARQTPDLPATICGDRIRTWGESQDRVARLAAVLPGYKAPQTVEFVDALPISGAGKILKRAELTSDLLEVEGVVTDPDP